MPQILNAASNEMEIAILSMARSGGAVVSVQLDLCQMFVSFLHDSLLFKFCPLKEFSDLEISDIKSNFNLVVHCKLDEVERECVKYNKLEGRELDDLIHLRDRKKINKGIDSIK